MQRLSKADKAVLMELGPWSDENIRGHNLVRVFHHKSGSVSVLVVASQLGYTQQYHYFYRWRKGVEFGEFIPTGELFDDHIPSLRACMSKLAAWKKETAY